MEWISPIEAIHRLGGDLRLLGDTIAPRLQIGALNAQADHFFVNNVRQGEDGKPCPVPARFWKLFNLSGTWKSGDFMGGGNQFAKDPSTFQVSGVKLSAAEIQVLREELEPLLSISDIQMKTAYSSNDSQTRDDIEMNPPLLPASAKPNHWKHLSYAHMAAKLLREDKSVLAEEAFRKVAPPDATRKDDSIRRAIRDAFDLIYKSDGTPL